VVAISVSDSRDNPIANATVVFQDAGGSLVSATRTDAQGNAAATMATGGSVTVDIESVDSVPKLYTYVDVKPGDHLQIGSPPSTINATVTAPEYPGLDPSTLSYHVETRCGFGRATNVSVPLKLSCTPVDVFVSVENKADGTLLAGFYAASVTVADGDVMDLTDHTYASLVPFDVELDDVPKDMIQMASLALAGLTDGTFVFERGRHRRAASWCRTCPTFRCWCRRMWI